MFSSNICLFKILFIHLIYSQGLTWGGNILALYMLAPLFRLLVRYIGYWHMEAGIVRLGLPPLNTSTLQGLVNALNSYLLTINFLLPLGLGRKHIRFVDLFIRSCGAVFKERV